MTEKDREGLRTWIEVDRKAIKHNFGVFKKIISKKTNPPEKGARVKLMAVVKSNAYGHGLIDFSKEMEKLGADFLGVDSMTEARAIRREGIKLPILVLGYTMPELFREAAKSDVSLTISTFENLNALKKIKLPKPLKIHIKVDTGMHRQGFLLGQQKTLMSKVKGQRSKVTIEGLYTHFASPKNPAFPKDTQHQLSEFREWRNAFKSAGLRPLVHAAATSGAMLFPDSHFDMVRIGIGLYGLWPAPEVCEFLKNKIVLKPALIWKSIVTEIKKLPKGSRIGYDLTEALGQNSTIGIVPVGYWHGYPRALSSIGRVMVSGKVCKVLGRVSMDMLTIDVSGVRNPKVGNEVVVMGGGDHLAVSAAGLARALDASWYELITRLNPLIKRIYK